MRDIVMPTYGDLDRKTLLEDINGKISVQTDETITRTADGKLSIPGGGSGYNLPPATETTLGGVIPDGVTTVVDANGVLTAIGGGMQGDSYTKAESDAKFVDVNGDYMNGNLTINQIPTVRTAMTVRDTRDNDELSVYVNDTKAGLFANVNDEQKDIVVVDRESGEVSSDVFYPQPVADQMFLKNVGGSITGSLNLFLPDGASDSRLQITNGTISENKFYWGINVSDARASIFIYWDNATGGRDVCSFDYTTKTFSSNVFVLQTTTLLDNIQSLPQSELINYEEEIQAKIVELQLTLAKAQENGFTKLINTTQSQLEILFNKLGEI